MPERTSLDRKVLGSSFPGEDIEYRVRQLMATAITEVRGLCAPPPLLQSTPLAENILQKGDKIIHELSFL